MNSMPFGEFLFWLLAETLSACLRCRRYSSEKSLKAEFGKNEALNSERSFWILYFLHPEVEQIFKKINKTQVRLNSHKTSILEVSSNFFLIAQHFSNQRFHRNDDHLLYSVDERRKVLNQNLNGNTTFNGDWRRLFIAKIFPISQVFSAPKRRKSAQ